ncbi:MAG: MBL fold hydrolase [Candidatus Omnitrophica bacterium CG11_big_fil_rev_8_21_14_0_20_45_26]|uniref:MBL fold hydrolase n=1 Tax=Candidatus Abzuiibacterium crystallinum TaxID=1974748 RepID=A0A2H0LQE3_9BACT|nr:MAG: MBL fold hydrolase [Candidatus Omnitrophica bacterium CG11_big_fil_rev_8_21_14_0_20_45_26]PIW65438.1 MAG: MBL fold hydrolase [Candidatus Omnitrophica bacterium CG12_big_fil_rev_8_21_14_0_65_45_16]
MAFMSAQKSRLYLKQMEVGPMENFVYLVGDREKREVFVVDPAWEVDRILSVVAEDGLKVKGALVTHHHFDHTNGLESLLSATDGVAYVQKDEAPFLKQVKSNVKWVESGEKIKIGDVDLTFIHTPGHTPGSQCFLVGDGLISGDTLFIGACGRCDLPGGNASQMFESLNRLAKLDDHTVLYPGHNYAEIPTSTIKQERLSNPYMQFDNVKNFLNLRMKG